MRPKGFASGKNRGGITIHMPQKWIIPSSVMSIFRKTRVNRILVKQCIGFITYCAAQCNQKQWILIIEGN